HGNSRTRLNRVCPFDIKGGLCCPAYDRPIVWIERFGAERSIYFKGRRIRNTKGLIKSMQVAGNSRASKGVNNDNCLAFTIIALIEQSIYAIGFAYLLWIVTGDSKLLTALLVRRWRR